MELPDTSSKQIIINCAESWTGEQIGMLNGGLPEEIIGDLRDERSCEGEKSVLDGRSNMCKGPEVSRGCIG